MISTDNYVKRLDLVPDKIIADSDPARSKP
jgi:hypothetical protein